MNENIFEPNLNKQLIKKEIKNILIHEPDSIKTIDHMIIYKSKLSKAKQITDTLYHND